MSLFDESEEKGATFSPCRLWRYTLWRRWAEGPTVNLIGLNPSTADETLDDPTIRRCIRFGQRWEWRGLKFGCYVMTNIFAFRATDPKDMKATPDPIGPDNDSALFGEASKAQLVIAAWGTHGNFLNRGETVRRLLLGPVGCQYATKEIHCLGVTKEGYPKHPLYLRGDTQPQLYGKNTIVESISIRTESAPTGPKSPGILMCAGGLPAVGSPGIRGQTGIGGLPHGYDNWEQWESRHGPRYGNLK